MSEYIRFVECLKREGIDYSVVDDGLITRYPIMVTAEHLGCIMSWWFDWHSEKLLGSNIDFILQD